MKKKYIGIAASAFLLVAAISVGGTLAWFTDQAQATNNVSIGNVKIEVEEPSWDEDDATNIWPGKETEKDPIVKNTGKNPSYVRIKVEYPTAYGQYLSFDFDTDENTGTWFKDGNYYYYKGVLAPGASTSPLFNAFTLSSLYEEPQNGVSPAFAIDVYAEAVQSQGFEPTNSTPEALKAAIKTAFDRYVEQENPSGN